MRVLILRDKRINTEDLERVIQQVSRLFSDNTPVMPKFFVREHDFENLPFSIYYGDAKGINRLYLEKTTAQIYKDWKEGVDFLVYMPHERNWHAEGMWGWNISTAFSGYEVEQVRWDADNRANTVGTLYHELFHALDSFTYRYTAVDISKIVGVTDWDDDVVHGEGDDWEYIRHKENQEALKAISTYFVNACRKRKAIFEKRVTIMKAIINKLEQVLEYQRRLLIQSTKEDRPCLPPSSRS